MAKAKFESDYPLPAITVDMVVFTITRRGRLEFLVIRRRDDPFKGYLALPGGFVDVGGGYRAGDAQGESLVSAAERELREETGLDAKRGDVFFEQLFTFGDPGRDPRGRVVSVAYYALVGMDVAPRVRAGDDAAEAFWSPVWDTPDHASVQANEHGGAPPLVGPLAFDHDKILRTAVERIQGKIDYDPRIARALLATEFTFNELYRVHEIVKGAAHDRSNFQKRFKRMIEDGLILEMEDVVSVAPGRGRPARLYRFAEKS
jgi:8-oxo-dGTP diphosphatase